MILLCKMMEKTSCFLKLLFFSRTIFNFLLMEKFLSFKYNSTFFSLHVFRDKHADSVFIHRIGFVWKSLIWSYRTCSSFSVCEISRLSFKLLFFQETPSQSYLTQASSPAFFPTMTVLTTNQLEMLYSQAIKKETFLFSSIFTAELNGIVHYLLTIPILHLVNKKFLIQTDSLIAITTIQEKLFIDPTIQNIHHQLENLRTKSFDKKLMYIPSHVGISGNE